MLHFLNSARLHGRFGCFFCGTPLVPQWRNPEATSHSPMDIIDAVGVYTTSEEKWEASLGSCQHLKPLDLREFEREALTSGYRHRADALDINEELLEERFAQYTPLVKKDGVIYRFRIVGVKHPGFTWKPKLLEQVEPEYITTTVTHHGCAYYGFFKPTIAEVLAQVPDWMQIANAFYIDQDHILISRCGSGHIAKTHWVKI